MIELYLLRHGEAEPRATHDSQRRLTPHGQAEVLAAAEHLPAQLDVLLHSPYLRTHESALQVLKQRSASTVQVADWLTPEAPVDMALEQLSQYSGSVLLVTHNPLVSYLAARLSGQSVNQTSFGTGSLAHLQGDDVLPANLSFAWL
ncbi:phosphohistidine phosphatase SixA [Salinispirillum sp. LH 10-3-1]|uniref:Phosphohistidine phosphatase SixA n=1 Tax=Salinispirillum sp. LH 10-3-1 TaxID=2952525 RepID=A0AB38YCF7_9GAMM